MKISESWLREWVNPPLDTAELAHQLTMLGLEVDSVEPAGEALDRIVVGRVEEVTQHPNADRLRVCRVDVGSGESLTIVCGASNVAVGGRYPTALIGASLPGGLKIKKGKLRGEPSHGMLCSAVELGISQAADGLLEIEGEPAAGTPVAKVLGLDDQIIDLDLTPNRADCFSLLGVARDLAASQRMPFNEPENAIVPVLSTATLPVELVKGAGCGRFVGRVIEGIDPAASTPLWMRERLRRCGIRPISPVVDVTNLVMLELGQPLHGYDHEKLSGGIVVRRAQANESLVLLGGQKVALDTEVLVIADGSGAIGMAGIMGGESTAVSGDTRTVFLESAFFEPDVLSGRARRFGLHTDASVRFERGVDSQCQARAIERATELLLEIVGGKAGPLTEERMDAHLPRPATIRLRRDRLAMLLGHDIPDRQVRELLVGLQMKVTDEPDGWSVTPSSSRFDIGIEVDLIEEVVRLYGYDHIPEIPGPLQTKLARSTELAVPIQRVRQTLVARGYQEVITYSFIEQGLAVQLGADGAGLTLSNPISADLSVMRPSLWPGLVKAMKHNLSRQQARVRLFESGIRFLQQDAEIIEENLLSGIVAGAADPEQWDQPTRGVDFFDLKADLEALLALSGSATEIRFQADDHPALRPGRSARVMRCSAEGETDIGWCGEMHPALTKQLELSATPVLFELLFEPAFAAHITEYARISKFPAVRRDIAVIVSNDIPVSSLVASVRDVAGPVLRDVVVFDVYAGKNIETGSKSVALGLILKETSRTLKDTDVDKCQASVMERLSRDFNATIRE